jgi:hypothetical protein
LSEAPYIDPKTPPSPGLDYLALRQQGLDIIQRLAGDVWTDFNAHDPGVTTLEQLCYALTELSYRSELPIEDLLVDPETNAIDLGRQGLFPPEDILSGGPLTENDYRKLIVDQVPAVGNVWLRRHESEDPGAVHGLCDIDLYLPGATSSAAPQDVTGQVARAYSAARGLCEDLHSIQILEPVPARLTTQVAIEPSARPETVAALILYHVSRLLAPELRRTTLDAMLAGGRMTADMLAGPLPSRGFVRDDDLEARRERFAIGDVTRVLRDVAGVAAVHSVRVSTPGASMDTRGGASEIAVPSASILKLDTDGGAGMAGIRVFQGEAECRLQADAVQRELTRLWSDHRRQYDTRAECKRLLSFPPGTAVDLKTYDLLQRQFPGVYGINEHGLPSDATDARRAQARQLQAFLLVFEQLLADGFARLAATAQGTSRDPSHQYLYASFPELLPLLKRSDRADDRAIEAGGADERAMKAYRAGVRTMETRERTAERRSRIRRSMLAMYGETDSFLAPASPESPGVSPGDSAASVWAQQGLLRHLPGIGMRRGTGFDYSALPAPDNASGLEMRTRLQLGLRPWTPPPFENVLRRFGLSDIQDAPHVSHRALMMRHARHIDEHFPTVPELFEASAGAADPRWSDLSEELLIAAAAPHQYRIGTLPGESKWAVVCRAPSQPLWQLAATYEEKSDALAGASALLRSARAIHRQARRLYIVEHSLLRFAPVAAGGDFEPSFTLSAVVSVPVRDAVDPGYRARVCRILRSNTPAHIVVRGCFLRFSRLCTFEALYWRWRDALRQGEGREDACRKLRDFLTADLP